MVEGIVIALGNPDRGDDGAGPALLARLRAAPPVGAALVDAGGDPLALLDLWSGRPWAVVLDVAVSGAPAGTAHRIEAGAGALPKDLGRCSTHGFGIGEAVELARSLGRMPGRLIVHALEGARFDRGAGLSPAVRAALPAAEAALRREIAALAQAPAEAEGR